MDDKVPSVADDGSGIAAFNPATDVTRGSLEDPHLQREGIDVEKEMGTIEEEHSEEDPDLVSWDGDDDPHYPMNCTKCAEL